MKNSINKTLRIQRGLIALLVFLALPLISSAERTNFIVPPAAQDNIERTDVWTEYRTFGGIKIEYRFQECDSQEPGMFKNMNVVFFRFTNNTSNKLELTWSTELYFDESCVNCDKIERDEYAHSVKLDANQIIEGNCTTKSQTDLYINANFIKLSPGMSGTKLTNFNLVNLQAKAWK
jgi:hypothetical protein